MLLDVNPVSGCGIWSDSLVLIRKTKYRRFEVVFHKIGSLRAKIFPDLPLLKLARKACRLGGRVLKCRYARVLSIPYAATLYFYLAGQKTSCRLYARAAFLRHWNSYVFMNKSFGRGRLALDTEAPHPSSYKDSFLRSRSHNFFINCIF